MPNDKDWKDGETVEHSDEEVEAFHKKFDHDLDLERSLKLQLDLPAGFFLTVHDGKVDLELSGGVLRNLEPAKAAAVVKEIKAVLRKHSLKSV